MRLLDLMPLVMDKWCDLSRWLGVVNRWIYAVCDVGVSNGLLLISPWLLGSGFVAVVLDNTTYNIHDIIAIQTFLRGQRRLGKSLGYMSIHKEIYIYFFLRRLVGV